MGVRHEPLKQHAKRPRRCGWPCMRLARPCCSPQARPAGGAVCGYTSRSRGTLWAAANALACSVRAWGVDQSRLHSCICGFRTCGCARSHNTGASSTLGCAATVEMLGGVRLLIIANTAGQVRGTSFGGGGCCRQCVFGGGVPAGSSPCLSGLLHFACASKALP